MAIETRIDADAGLVILTGTGNLKFVDLAEAYESLFKHPDFRPGLNSLWNFKDAVLTVATQQLPDAIKILQRHQGERGEGFRVAIVVRRNADYGLSTLFGMQAFDQPFEYQVFQSLTEATKWVTE